MLRQITKGASRAESSQSCEPGLIEVIIDGLDPDVKPLWALSELEETVQEDAAVQLAHVLDYTDEASLDPLSKTGEFSGFTKAITAAFAKVGQLAVEKGESAESWKWTACLSDTGASKSGDDEPYDKVCTWINFQAVDDSVGSRFSQRYQARSAYDPRLGTWQTSLHRLKKTGSGEGPGEGSSRE